MSDIIDESTVPIQEVQRWFDTLSVGKAPSPSMRILYEYCWSNGSAGEFARRDMGLRGGEGGGVSTSADFVFDNGDIMTWMSLHFLYYTSAKQSLDADGRLHCRAIIIITQSLLY